MSNNSCPSLVSCDPHASWLVVISHQTDQTVKYTVKSIVVIRIVCHAFHLFDSS